MAAVRVLAAGTDATPVTDARFPRRRRATWPRPALALLLLGAASCTSVGDPAPETWETRKLTDGAALLAPPVPEDKRGELEAALAASRAASEAAPDDVDALIALGRRLGTVGRFREAVDVFTRGLQGHPDDARPWRFRGHRLITLRQFDAAEADLERAAALVEGRHDDVEPSMTPNARGVDLDTLQENIHYHLALARYLQGDWAAAARSWERCRELARNDDGICMASYWMAMAYARGGSPAMARRAVAGVTADMDIVEYHAYHQLALVWKGERDGDELLSGTPPDGDTAIDFATIGYGVGCWHWCQGRQERAREIWRQVEAGPMWHAFGHIAAEAELARLRDS